MNQFKVGDKVFWSSQAGGHDTKKEGEILYIVPPEVRPLNYLVREIGSLEKALEMYYVQAIDPRTLPRKEESYIVLVLRGMARPALYWPRTSNLIKE